MMNMAHPNKPVTGIDDMQKVLDIMTYFCDGRALSKARLAKMIYLADWKSCLENGHQITDSKWIYDHYGPYLKKFYELAKEDERFQIYSYGHAEMIGLKSGVHLPKFQKDEENILSDVKKLALSEPFKDFLKRIYATYPIKTQKKYSELNLVALASASKNNNNCSIL